jgi:hypothetical protein
METFNGVGSRPDVSILTLQVPEIYTVSLHCAEIAATKILDAHELQVSVFFHNDCKGIFFSFSGSGLGLWSKSLSRRDSHLQYTIPALFVRFPCTQRETAVLVLVSSNDIFC